MDWNAFWTTMLLIALVLALGFVNLRLSGLPVNTFLICAVLFGQMYNDLAK